jgi:hypothetical protein
VLHEDVLWLGIVVHDCNPSTWKAEIVGGEFQASQGYIVGTCLKKQKQSGMAQWLTPVTLVSSKAKIERILVGGQLGQKVGETPSQPIKVECGGTCLSSQQFRKHK